jgi:hypothetical protein
VKKFLKFQLSREGFKMRNKTMKKEQKEERKKFLKMQIEYYEKKLTCALKSLEDLMKDTKED